MKFVDLFAGLGGFHTGFTKSGYECVFACEIDPALRELYKSNYGIEPHGDITKIKAEDIPQHDILCAGFPCQPFSLAGKKKGSECPSSGKLIDDVVRVAKYHKPKFVVLENVPNILAIADGKFWEYLVGSFEAIGYNIQHKIISPVEIGIPQNRRRIFVVASRDDVNNDINYWPEEIKDLDKVDLKSYLDNGLESIPLEDKKQHQLSRWQNLLDNCQLPTSLCAFSLVAPEFGATYPIDFSEISLDEMKQHHGSYGQSLKDCETWEQLLELMPSYTRKNRKVAAWIVGPVEYSRKVYTLNSNFLDNWCQTLDKRNNTWQILEWRGKHHDHNLYSHLVQFRASGIRILKPEIAPSLISMTPTQIPIIPSESRYLSKYEAAKLQFLHNLKHIPENTPRAFKALGNAVNAKIVEQIANNLRTAFI